MRGMIYPQYFHTHQSTSLSNLDIDPDQDKCEPLEKSVEPRAMLEKSYQLISSLLGFVVSALSY